MCIRDSDKGGHIQTDINLETCVKGIFAAGDIRANSASQLISSAGDGVTAAVNAKKYLTGQKLNSSFGDISKKYPQTSYILKIHKMVG